MGSDYLVLGLGLCRGAIIEKEGYTNIIEVFDLKSATKRKLLIEKGMEQANGISNLSLDGSFVIKGEDNIYVYDLIILDGEDLRSVRRLSNQT